MQGKYPSRLRKCYKCGEPGFRGDWGRAASGRLRTMCKKCELAWQTKSKTLGRVEAGPCMQCQKPFFVQFASIAKRRKFCSYQCGDIAQATPRACARCLDVKQPADFARGPSGRRNRKCKDCMEESDRRLVHGDPIKQCRPGPGQVLDQLRKVAKRHSQPCTIKRFQMRALYAKACALCGAPMTALKPIDRKQPFDVSNVRPMCAPCSRLLERRKFEDVLLLAHAIAAHSPLEVQKNAKPNARKPA